MRRLLLALPLALLPFTAAHAHGALEHDHDHAHGSLAAHEHGVARLNAVLDGKALELELDSPAMNLVGFEHAASSDADKAKVATVGKQLEQPLGLFALAAAANCSVENQELQSPLFDDQPVTPDVDDNAHDHQHSDVHAHYQFTCANPAKLTGIDLTPLFKAFPATQKITVQLIGPNGQKGLDVTPANAVVSF